MLDWDQSSSRLDAMNTDISIFYFTVNENPLLIGWESDVSCNSEILKQNN